MTMVSANTQQERLLPPLKGEEELPVNPSSRSSSGGIAQPRPPLPTRRATAPASASASASPKTNIPQHPLSCNTSVTLPYRPRNASPFSRNHLRSYSASPLSIPMARAHSSPGGVEISSRHYTISSARRPPSPLGPPTIRRPSPLRRSNEDFHTSYSGLDIRETIAEHHELETPVQSSRLDEQQPTSSPTFSSMTSATFPRVRRRPSSPLFQTLPSPSSSAHSSPLLPPSRYNFNEPYPISYPFSATSSSMPSTPTSFRSRSPSISSLETIPDSSDAEEAAEALEAERIAKLKAAAEEEAKRQMEKEGKRRSSMDVQRGRNMTIGSPYGRSDKRKRWSVCGAERRGDLDLETIWED